MKNDLDLNSLLLVQALAASGSFTAAAERLGSSKTKISLQIKALEQQLGVALFRRTTRQVSLTAEGMQLVERCLPLLDELRGELQQLSQTDAERILPLATRVKIEDFEQLDDGLLGITIAGIERVKITERWQEADQLNVARTEALPPWPKLQLHSAFQPVVPALQQIYLQNPSK